MKPPQQKRPGNRPPGGGGPRRPGGPGDGPDRPRQGGPRPYGAARPAGPREGARQAGESPRRSGPRSDPARPREERPDRPQAARPPRGGDPSGPRRFPAGAKPRPDRAAEDRPQGPRPPAPEPAATRRAPFRPAPRAADRSPPADDPDLDSPRGTVWLYGLHAVGAALANPARRLRRLLLTEEAEAALAARHRQPWPLTPEHVQRGRLDHLLGRETVHQGAALLADHLATPALAQALERRGPVLVLDQVADPRNVGAILRSAQAFGVAAVVVQERHAPEETGALAKAASGALESVPLLRAVNLARTLVALKAAGCWVVGLDSGGAPLSGPALAERRVVLVLGSEGEGLRRLTRETCDEVAGIGLPGAGGGLDSLNVSAAAAVALYELGRRA